MFNKVILMGRPTADIEIRYAQGSNKAVGRFTLAVDKQYKREGDEQTANFIRCVAFEKTAEFISQYFGKGRMILVEGYLDTGDYTNKDGQKVYYTEVVVTKANFTGEKRESQPAGTTQDRPKPQPSNGDGFMNIPDGIDEELPFN